MPPHVKRISVSAPFYSARSPPDASCSSLNDTHRWRETERKKERAREGWFYGSEITKWSFMIWSNVLTQIHFFVLHEDLIETHGMCLVFLPPILVWLIFQCLFWNDPMASPDANTTYWSFLSFPQALGEGLVFAKSSGILANSKTGFTCVLWLECWLERSRQTGIVLKKKKKRVCVCMCAC